MGWWSSDILGGDEPLDALAGLERATGWKESEGLYDAQADVHRRKLKARLVKHFSKPSVVEKTKKYVTELTRTADSHASILAVVFVLIKLEIKFDNFVEQLAYTALAHDEIDDGWKHSDERAEAREDFKRRLDVFRKRAPATQKYEVYLTKHTSDSGKIEVTAVSASEAKKIAIKRVEDGAKLNEMPTVRCEVDEVLEVKEVYDKTHVVESDQ